MYEARWYPTLTRLADGRVLALSGLDDIGQIVPGKCEICAPKTKTWKYSGRFRQFHAYPAAFATKYASVIRTARLIHSSSTAHVTDVEQRSAASP